MSNLSRTIVDDLEPRRLLELASLGARMAVVCPDLERAREVLQQLQAAAPAGSPFSAFRFVLANGRERVDHPDGGTIRLVPWRWWGDRLRGAYVDRVYLLELHDVPREQLAAVIDNAFVATSTAEEPAIVQVIGRGEEWTWPRHQAARTVGARVARSAAPAS